MKIHTKTIIATAGAALLLLGCGGVEEDSEANIKAKGEDQVSEELTPEQKKEAEKSGFDTKSFDNPTPTGKE